MKQLFLPKGQSVMFLNYIIKNCENNDGLVLLSPKKEHMGNYGEGTEENVNNAKQAALIFYMLARPKIFATSILHKIMDGSGSGTVHEWYLLRTSLLSEYMYKTEADFPPEIKEPIDGMNCLIGFNGKPLKWIR
jgi:hypothetical protein